MEGDEEKEWFSCGRKVARNFGAQTALFSAVLPFARSTLSSPSSGLVCRLGSTRAALLAPGPAQDATSRWRKLGKPVGGERKEESVVVASHARRESPGSRSCGGMRIAACHLCTAAGEAV